MQAPARGASAQRALAAGEWPFAIPWYPPAKGGDGAAGLDMLELIKQNELAGMQGRAAGLSLPRWRGEQGDWARQAANPKPQLSTA